MTKSHREAIRLLGQHGIELVGVKHGRHQQWQVTDGAKLAILTVAASPRCESHLPRRVLAQALRGLRNTQ